MITKQMMMRTSSHRVAIIMSKVITSHSGSLCSSSLLSVRCYHTNNNNRKQYTNISDKPSPSTSSSSSSSSLSKRYFSSNSNNQFSKLSDKEMQLVADDIVVRLGYLKELVTVDGFKSYMKIYKDVCPFFPLNLKLFSDLQNPLLSKYNFDVYDFNVGCKEAFSQVFKAIASKEFYRSSNASVPTDADDFLQSTLHPRLYVTCVDALKKMQVANMESYIEDLNIKMYVIETIVTEIIYENDIDDIRKIYDEVDKVRYDTSSTATGDISVDGTNEDEVDVDGRRSMKKKLDDLYSKHVTYPVGSVVATINVYFETEEKYSTVFTGDSTDDKPTISSRSDRNLWTFRGCISGQIPLDWKIVGLGGVVYID